MILRHAVTVLLLLIIIVTTSRVEGAQKTQTCPRYKEAAGVTEAGRYFVCRRYDSCGLVHFCIFLPANRDKYGLPRR